MSYQVLARKWRPQLFEDVVGQGHVTRTLQNAIATNRLAHAFLFSGPRGVGKTTTARILAKALNCKQGPTPSPCGKCDSCLETAAGTSVDVIEIDGASNRGIEHIRELREAVKYAPAAGKYKVYVIDEVHMLTNEAFNALLKTLEEPPPHVLFIFATTEPQKIPATIHSRCQRYGFKRIALAEIITKLKEIAGKEGITVSDQGLGMIARAAEGSMRDSQSLLDQAVSYSGTTIKDDDLRAILGAVPQELLAAFARMLLAKDAPSLLAQVDEQLERGQDMRQLLAGIVEHVRNLLVVKTAADPARIIELPSSDVDALRQQAASPGQEELILLFDALSRTLDEMRWSPHQRFTLEVGLIKACNLAPLQPLSEALERMSRLEARLGRGASADSPLGAAVVRERTTSYSAHRPADASRSIPAAARPAGAPNEAWHRVIQAIRDKRPGLASALENSSLLESSDDHLLVVGIRGAAFQLDKVGENKALIEQIAAETLGKKTAITFRKIAEETNPAPRKASPAKKAAPEQPDPAVQNVLDVFGGHVIDTEEREE